MSRVLFVVQAYGSSHDIVSKELIEKSKRIEGDVITHMDLVSNPPDISTYDLIICYVWEDTGTIDMLMNHAYKTVIMMGAGHHIEPESIEHFERLPDNFKMIGHVNIDMLRFFSIQFPNHIHLYLTNGVDIDMFRPIRGKKNTQFTIGWVGDRKNPTKHFEKAEQVKELIPNIDLFICEDHPHDKMPEYYNAIDCLIVTSDTEAHPAIVYEAMACGIPVITPNVGDVHEFIINHVNGFIVKPDADPEDYALIIKHLIDNPEVGKYIKNSSRLTILQRLDWDHIKQSWEALLPEEKEIPEFIPVILNGKPGGIPLPKDPKVAKAVCERYEEVKKLETEPRKIRTGYRIRAITWGGAFFLGLVEDDLKERSDFKILDRLTTAEDLDPETFDILYVISPRIMKRALYRKVLKEGKHIIYHWIGSDILGLRDEYEANGNNLPAVLNEYPKQQHHFGVSQNLVEELKEMGLEGKEMNLVSNWSLPIHPLPDEFTVLVYYPPVGSGKYANLYGQDVLKKLAKKRKDIKFIFYGLRGGQKPDFKAKNVTFEYWHDTEDGMRDLYNRGSVLLRYNMHDGYPSSTIEMCMRGGQVITNGKFPYTIYVKSVKEIEEALDDIKDYKVLNVRGSRYYNKNQCKDVFLNAFMTYVDGLRI